MVGPSTLNQMVAMLQASGDLGPGRTFWVGGSVAAYLGKTGNDTHNGLDPRTPFSTIEYALANHCVASRGDNIILMPGFTLDITAAAGLDLDIAGLTVWGLGNGSLRPTITCSGTTDTLDADIDAANIRIHNVYFDMTGNDAVDAFIDVNAADTTFTKCYFLLADSGGQVDIGVDVGTGAHRTKFKDCTFFGDTAASVAVTVGAVVTEFTMENCKLDLVGAAGVGCVEFTAAATDVVFKDCYFRNNVASATTTVDCNANAVTGAMINCQHVLGTIATAGSGILPVTSTGQAAYIASFLTYCVNDQDAAGAGEFGAAVGTAST